ncbi:1624_t:CDS:2 [Dentiscutata erythropus]|uniref:1624_t:CDS:1 n=1 Tax=Dentiscutata erythropus TaxID=1348616 RepID=A0A9N8VHY0_9GLOM|nr:1624_t:CDS:2 [Dentiscutata erythropus]
MPPPYPSFKLPASLLPITTINPAMRPKRYSNVCEAKKAGSIDYIQVRSTRYKVYSLFEKMGGSIMLSEIPQLYLEEYNRALEYQGKLSYAIENEFPGVYEFIQALPGNQTVVIFKAIWENVKSDVIKAQKCDTSNVAAQDLSLDHKTRKDKKHSHDVIHSENDRGSRRNNDKKRKDTSPTHTISKSMRKSEETKSIRSSSPSEFSIKRIFDDKDFLKITELQRDVLELLFFY